MGLEIPDARKPCIHFSPSHACFTKKGGTPRAKSKDVISITAIQETNPVIGLRVNQQLEVICI
jgi:hypothetical protein